MQPRFSTTTFVLSFLTFLMMGALIIYGPFHWWENLNPKKPPNAPLCPPVFFDTIGFLPIEPEFRSGQPHDISANGLRVVGESTANEPDSYEPNDGNNPVGSGHCAEAFGWTRRCGHTPFYFTAAYTYPPKAPKTGIFGFGYLPGAQASHTESYAFGISPDGKVVVGYNTYDPAYYSKAVVFYPDGIYPLVLPDKTKYPEHHSSLAYDVSQSGGEHSDPGETNPKRKNLLDRRIIVGWASSTREEPFLTGKGMAVYWDGPENIIILPTPATITAENVPVISSDAVAISDDGSVIAGNLFYDSRSNGLQYDGVPCVWKRTLSGAGSLYEYTVLDDLPGGYENATVRHISGDGKTLVGWGNEKTNATSCAGIYAYQACYWEYSSADKKWSGAKKLQTLTGNMASIANGVNYDGSVIVGNCLNIIDKSAHCDPDSLEFPNTATIWWKSAKGVTVENIAVILGTNVPDGWQLYWAERVSADGLIITGYGYACADCPQQAWVAGIPPRRKDREIIDDKK